MRSSKTDGVVRRHAQRAAEDEGIGLERSRCSHVENDNLFAGPLQLLCLLERDVVRKFATVLCHLSGRAIPGRSHRGTGTIQA